MPSACRTPKSTDDICYKGARRWCPIDPQADGLNGRQSCGTEAACPPRSKMHARAAPPQGCAHCRVHSLAAATTGCTSATRALPDLRSSRVPIAQPLINEFDTGIPLHATDPWRWHPSHSPSNALPHSLPKGHLGWALKAKPECCTQTIQWSCQQTNQHTAGSNSKQVFLLRAQHTRPEGERKPEEHCADLQGWAPLVLQDIEADTT
jgi:hypothetical protein